MAGSHPGLGDQATIFIVDDDDLFRESVERNLRIAGYAVRSFSNGRDFLSALMEPPPSSSLVLLDWKMPSMNGIDVLQHMRETGISLPVIFLTVLGDQIYEEAALAGGAVDFIEKSRSFTIVARRIEIILSGLRRAADGEDAGDLNLGAVSLHGNSQRVRWKNQDVALTLTEYRLVRYLVSHAGQDISYRVLYDLVHGQGFSAGAGEHGYRANVRAFIKRIRHKFRDVDENFDAIGNYPGFGYRWIKPEDGSAS